MTTTAVWFRAWSGRRGSRGATSSSSSSSRGGRRRLPARPPAPEGDQGDGAATLSLPKLSGRVSIAARRAGAARGAEALGQGENGRAQGWGGAAERRVGGGGVRGGGGLRGLGIRRGGG